MDKITLEPLQKVFKDLKSESDLFFTTPTIQCTSNIQHIFPSVGKIFIKLESMQCTGSFKARGVLNQFRNLSIENKDKTLVSMSAGNYGKAFSYIGKEKNRKIVVFMPDTAPVDRKQTMESFGAEVYQCPTKDLMSRVNDHVNKNGSLFLHSFDDFSLIMGHASAGLELVDQMKNQFNSCEPDFVLVCCGGGGYLAGVAVGLRLCGWNKTKIIGVEPKQAPTMYNAMKAGKITDTKVGKTIASGLAPPFAGELAFSLVKEHVDEIVLVTDEQLKSAMRVYYKMGLVSEPSGAAAMAALISGQVKDVEGKNVVVFLTGGNVTTDELNTHIGKRFV